MVGEQGKATIKDIDIYIGNKLRSKRQKVGLTLSDLAEKLGISHQQIQKYERGQSRISAGTLYQLSAILGVKSNFFFDGYNASSNIDKEQHINDVISPERRRKLNILIVEDDPADELLLRKAIEECNVKANIFCIHDGAKALDFLKSREFEIQFPRPDIILLDLNIPKRDGHEVLKEIKKDRKMLDIPVIIISNGVSIKDMVNAYKSHASGYVCKSFDFNSFSNNINIVLRYWSDAVVLPLTAA